MTYPGGLAGGRPGITSLLSTLRPSRRAQRAALAAALVSLAVFVLLAPFARIPLNPVPAFLPAYQSALVVCDLITAVLLAGQYAIVRSRALLALAAGYLFGALMAAAHALSFPGVFAAQGLLGAGPQTTAWLYFLWHGGFPLFVIAYAHLKERPDEPARAPAGLALAGAALLAMACAGTLVLLATAGHALLPRLMAGDQDGSAKVWVAVATWLVGLAALAALWRRRPHAVLELWLMVVLCAWLADSALAAVFNHARYDLGWYAGRIYGLAASVFVLAVLLRENSVLYARLADAHALLERQNTQLAEASRLKSEFLANMSHELRTPLNAVIGFSEVLKDGLAGELKAEQREYVTDIHSSGQHLLSLINDILDLSKIEAGHSTLDLEPSEAGALFEHSLSIVREKAARQRVTLALDAPGDLGRLLLDPRKTKQILYNLLSNAVKFSPGNGRVALRARRVPRADVEAFAPSAVTVLRPRLPVAGHAEYLQISVEDTGIGIAPEDAPKLFRMFSQIDSSLSREAEGTGLGLALVERLALLHEGAVGLASNPGAGSRFVVWLPWRATSASRIAALPAQRAQAPAVRRPIALLIEDNHNAAELMRLQLEPEGFEIARATCARDALEWLQLRQPTVVILDLLLPDMDGWDLLAKLKQPEAPTARIPVVIVSIVADARKGFSLGASGVLQKPVSREELLHALADTGALGQHETTRVLLVDDDPKALELLAAYLPGPGFQVLRACGGREGIALARRERPDLIVLDLMMPEVSGFDVVDALKDHADTADIPIVVVTAKTLTPQDKDTLYGLVAVVLQKSEFDRGGFVREVRRAVAPLREAAA
jgi:signal transduction histidine kinase/CheY-like chemotaxis protein